MEAQQLGDHHYDRLKELKEFDESKAGVKGLSDSGITSIPRIFVHPPESLSDIVKKPDDSQPSISIPVIDLSGVNSPSDRPKLVDQVKQAAKEWGFFQVINHGIPQSVQNDTVSAVKAFFELPHDAKAKHYNRLKGERGVLYASNIDLFHSAAAGWRDSIQVRQLPEGEEEEEEVPEVCRREILAWFPVVTGLAEVLMELLGEGLGLERGRLKELSFLGSRALSGHYYPYCPEPDRTVGFTSHTDRPMLTVVTQNQVPGLQVNHNGVWVDVKPQLGGLVVNIGDFFQVIISLALYN